MESVAVKGEGLSLGYLKGKQRKVILEQLNFELKTKELTCLLGPNGVGKSTLVKAMMGQLIPFEGKLELKKKNVSEYAHDSRAKMLSVVLSEPHLPGNLTVEQLVSLGRTPYLKWYGALDTSDKAAVNRALEITQVDYIRKELVNEISDGQRQKVLIARALAQDSPVMILDEPTAHLDLINRYEIMRLLQEIAHAESKAILVVTHDLEIALESADQFWLLSCGLPLITGKPEDLVISGQINQLYPSDRYEFDLLRGRVRLREESSNLEIIGDQDLTFWVKKALLKAGFQQLDGPVLIQSNPILLRYQELEFSRLDKLIDFLRKN
ncbi:ABC transporter ATP-binding protein [Algoriphagus hitonicola]|uniref:Iron complex transport system ATP-binding protein n=1 Tax=Algoriphagus hitonicola TaxID=435880 RepID=A0A1I2X1M7_9BACT|nr:ABC transporter ATP-binding protein [Algoriphagus hitonicola]SFH06576.1 iron complex transport system ATP-binding protein [Algoriphagus hitonicola]